MSNKRKDKFNILTLLAVISFFIALLGNIIKVYFDWINSGFNMTYNVVSIITELSWLTAQLFVYLLLVLNQHLKIQNINYQIKYINYFILD